MNVLSSGEKIVKEYVDKELIPGAAYAFVSAENTEIGCYGYKSLKPVKEETSLDTLYDMASLSKVVATSTMMLKLHEEGLIHFNDKVSDILPEYPYKDTEIIDLLIHVSGMVADDKNYKKCKSKEELWQFLINLPLHNPRRTVVEYSCPGYITLGKIIEHFKGSIDSYAKEVLFDKLETKDMLYCPKKNGRLEDCVTEEYSETRGWIKGEVHDGKAFIMNGVAGNAGLFASIKAVAAFVEMMLNDGTYKGKTILKKETMELFKRCWTPGMNESRTIGSWYFADHSTSAGNCISDCSLFHTGFTGTSIYIDFVRKYGIVLLTNAVHISRSQPTKELRIRFHDAILEEYDRMKGMNMTENNKLKDEELEKVTGGYDFKFYDYTFDENTKVKDLTDKYPWVLNLYPQLKTAASFGLTVAQGCTIAGISYENLQATLTEYEGKYNADGTLKNLDNIAY